MTHQFNTPVLFLIFNRPDTTREVFAQIKKMSPQYLFIASDGPRKHVKGEKERCEQARLIVNDIDWDCEVKTLFRDKNLGCGLAVSSAIGWFFDQVPEGIILEDDCYPELSFFTYCQELLMKYRDTDKVKLIGGNNFQNGITRGAGSYYFSHYPEIWGWASWRRAWKNYNFEITALEESFATGNLKTAFKTNREKRYWFKKFQLTRQGKADTWDYQLMYAILKNNGIAICPQVNLVKNIGIDNNATHHSLKDSHKDLEINRLPLPLIHPEMVVDKTADFYAFTRIYGRTPQRLIRLIKENGLINFFRYYLKQVFK